MRKPGLTMVAMLVVWAVVAEATLRLLCLSPRLEAVLTGIGPEPLVADARLGLRGNAAYPGHDDWGYRNVERPALAAIVAMGDSQTYGTGVTRDEAWPSALERRLGVRVYSMATPNFGTAHYWLEIDRALTLHPRVILVTVYFGNDLYDAFRLGTLNPQVGALVPEELLAAGRDLETRAPLATTGQTLFEPTAGARRALSTPRRLLSEHSRLYNLASALARRVSDRTRARAVAGDFVTAYRSLSPEQRALTSPYEGDGWRTILTAPYRRTVVDRRDPRIQAGLAVLRGSLARIAARSREGGARLVVVFIPTKESVFASRIANLAEHPGLAELVADEDQLKRTVVADLDALAVEHVDLLAALRAAPTQPYPETMDGHANAVGHEAIAGELARALEQEGRAQADRVVD